MAKIAKQITLAEFRAWISGIEELQDAKWSPDKKQWQLIRAKIDMIEDCYQYQVPRSPDQEFRDMLNTPIIPPSSLPVAHVQQPLVNNFKPQMQTDALGRPLDGNSTIGGMRISSNGALKTPDLQTSEYNTSFE